MFMELIFYSNIPLKFSYKIISLDTGHLISYVNFHRNLFYK